MTKKRKRGLYLVFIGLVAFAIVLLAGFIGYVTYKPVNGEKATQFAIIAEMVWLQKDDFSSENSFSISGKEVEEKINTKYLSQKQLNHVTISVKNEIITVSDQEIIVEINKQQKKQIVIEKRSKILNMTFGIIIGLLISSFFIEIIKNYLKEKEIL